MSDRQIVKKDKHLILARNTWSEVEGKLFATLIKELNPKNEKDFRPLTITIKELEKLWNVQINTTQIRQVCHDLQSKAYEIPLFKEDGKTKRGYKYFSLFHKIVYEFDDRYIQFQFHDDMKPFLIDFANQFVNYKIENILRFKSKYTLSFYEYFKLQTQFKKEPMIIEVIILEELREWLDLNKSKSNELKNDKYTRVNDLKKYILEKVKNDLKKFSDVYMDYDFIKTGRKITHIKFSFTKNLEKEERETLFSDDEFDNRYKKYFGKNCFYKNVFFENIKRIIPIDNFLKVEFENNTVLKIPTLKDLESIIEKD